MLTTALFRLYLAAAGLACPMIGQCLSSWSSGPTMPQGRASIDAAKDAQGRIYIAGGQTTSGATATTIRFDEATGTWTTLPAVMATARGSAATASDAQGRIYVFGGVSAGGVILASVERYDPIAGGWTVLAPMPQPLFLPKAVTSGDGMNIYVLGGSSVPGNSTSAVHRYDVSTGLWHSEPSMLRPRIYFGAVMGPGGYVYAIGGTQWNTSSATNGTVERRDPATGQWSMVAPLAAHPHQVGEAVVDAAGTIYVLGGWNPGLTAAVERYDVASNIWQTCTSLPQATNNCAAIAGPSGHLWLFGGDGPASTTRWAHPTGIMVTGRVRMIVPVGSPTVGVAAATVDVRQSQTTVATATTDAQGFYSLALPNSLGAGMYTIRATIGGLGGGHPPVVNYRYPDPMTQAPVANPDGDLIQLVAGSNPGMDILVPKPVILVHGVLSDPSRWQSFADLLREDPAHKWQLHGRTDRAYIAYSLGYDAGPALYAHLNQTLDSSAGVFNGNLNSTRVAWSSHLPLSSPIDIVAHSMGGLVTRAYLHNHAAPNSVDRVFTLGTPHIGQFSICFGAWWYSLPLPVALQQMDPIYLFTQFQPAHSQTAGARFVLVGASGDLNPIEPEGWLPPGNLEEDDSLVSTFSSVQYPFYMIPGFSVLATHTVPDIHWDLNDNSPPGGDHGTLFWVMTALETLH